MRATLSNYDQSPRKTRLVVDLIRGKSVTDAKRALMFLSKKSAPAILKLLDSAVANARSTGVSPDALIVKDIAVNKGIVMSRYKPMARGRSSTFRRKRSTISLTLARK